MNNNNLPKVWEDKDDNLDDDLESNLDELIDKYRYAEVEFDDWYEYTIEEWTEKLEALEYTDPEIKFSGFCSQGDGAGFESGYDIDKFIDNNKPLIIQWLFPNISDGIDDLKNYLSIYIKHDSGSYCHKESFTLNVDVEGEGKFIDYEKMEDFARDIEYIIEKEREDLCDKIYNALRPDYERLTSDECIKEYLISNELWKEPESKL